MDFQTWQDFEKKHPKPQDEDKKDENDEWFCFLTLWAKWRKRMKACFSLRLCFNAPHLAETTSPIGSVCFAKLSKRELDKSCSSLLPCGAKPSALAV
jgi:hypothetical protein